MADLNQLLATGQSAVFIAKQIEALNLTLIETNKVLRSIEKLQDERNGALMQIVDAVKAIDFVELSEPLEAIETAINNIDLTT